MPVSLQQQIFLPYLHPSLARRQIQNGISAYNKQTDKTPFLRNVSFRARCAAAVPMGVIETIVSIALQLISRCALFISQKLRQEVRRYSYQYKAAAAATLVALIGMLHPIFALRAEQRIEKQADAMADELLKKSSDRLRQKIDSAYKKKRQSFSYRTLKELDRIFWERNAEFLLKELSNEIHVFRVIYTRVRAEEKYFVLSRGKKRVQAIAAKADHLVLSKKEKAYEDQANRLASRMIKNWITLLEQAAEEGEEKPGTSDSDRQKIHKCVQQMKERMLEFRAQFHRQKGEAKDLFTLFHLLPFEVTKQKKMITAIVQKGQQSPHQRRYCSSAPGRGKGA